MMRCGAAVFYFLFVLFYVFFFCMSLNWEDSLRPLIFILFLATEKEIHKVMAYPFNPHMIL